MNQACKFKVDKIKSLQKLIMRAKEGQGIEKEHEKEGKLWLSS